MSYCSFSTVVCVVRLTQPKSTLAFSFAISLSFLWRSFCIFSTNHTTPECVDFAANVLKTHKPSSSFYSWAHTHTQKKTHIERERCISLNAARHILTTLLNEFQEVVREIYLVNELFLLCSICKTQQTIKSTENKSIALRLIHKSFAISDVRGC